jgi:YVTN family beta-propeller protein
VAITPDGTTAYVTNVDAGTVTPIDTATNTAGTPIPVAGGSKPRGVAITPDQAPVAALSATPARAGQPSSFDASPSTDPDGTVASYEWDFGDGSSATTLSATTTHTYAGAGGYTVTVTETDDAGCSTSLVFTGQTVSCNGSSAAQASLQVTIAAACSGLSIANDAGSQSGSPGQPFTGSFTVAAQNCTGADLTNVKMQGGTAGWLAQASTSWTTDPISGTVSASSTKKNTTLTARFPTLADQASASGAGMASVTVMVRGTVPPHTACGSQLPISGSWSASAVAPDGTTIRSPYTPSATITVTCGG